MHLSRPLPRVALITLDNPPVNTLSPECRAELRAVLAELDADLEVRAVVLTGAGRLFTAGADLTADLAMTAGQVPEFLADFGGVVDAIEDFRAPVLAAVNGPAVGGGFELALACDIRLASTESYFVAAGVNVGLLANYWRLVRTVGLGPAKDVLLTGERCAVEDALRWGLVTRVHPPEALLAEALATAARIASRAPLSVEAAKRCANQAALLSRTEADAVQVKEFTALYQSRDHREALRAFFERSPGEFHRR